MAASAWLGLDFRDVEGKAGQQGSNNIMV